jgi:hypothetical protein
MKENLLQDTRKIFDLLIDHKLELISYFQLDLNRYLVLLKIFENFYGDMGMKQEDIIEQIPTPISSRSNLINIINEACARELFVKETMEGDHRKRTIVPSKQLQVEFKEWMALCHQTHLS